MQWHHYIRERREQRHYSQVELAELLDASVASVSRWERGRCLPQPYLRRRLQALFDDRVTITNERPSTTNDGPSEEHHEVVYTSPTHETSETSHRFFREKPSTVFE